MRLVIIESPFAGGVTRNVEYARRALLHSLRQGEAPAASHLLYPQVLDDLDAHDRARGLAAGLAWAPHAEAAIFYVDHGISPGMRAAWAYYLSIGLVIETRKINP